VITWSRGGGKGVGRTRGSVSMFVEMFCTANFLPQINVFGTDMNKKTIYKYIK
jgi:hypothetical protein